jgi:hypothetical protein
MSPQRCIIVLECLCDRTPQGYGANTMPKELKNKRESKKKPAMTPKEKKAAKRSKKEAKV